jgi:hypothetical protein
MNAQTEMTEEILDILEGVENGKVLVKHAHAAIMRTINSAHLTKPDAGGGEWNWPMKGAGHCACRFIREQEFGDAKQVEWCGLHAKHRDLLAARNAELAPPSDVPAEPRNACLYDPDDVAFPKGFMPIDHPTPVQGEPLPVVAYLSAHDGYAYTPDEMSGLDGMKPLTDHAQATAEIAKKEAFWKRVVNVADAQTNQYIEKCKALEAELATLRTQLSTALAESGEMAEAMKWLLDSSMVYLASNSSTSQDVSVWNRASDCLDVWEKGLGRHTTTQESADKVGAK